MSSPSFDKAISREPSPTKIAPILGAEPSAQGRIPMDPFSTSTRSSGSASPVKQSPFQPILSQARQNAPPSNAAIDLVIANAMANAPAPPHLGIMDQNARIGNEINRIRTPSAINNLFPAAVGIDGRVNLFVGNLPYRVRWQDLKDLFRRAGTVLRADVSLGQDNRSRGYGTVLMGSREDGAKAIDLFNGFNWQTRTLEVRPDRLPPEYEPQAGNTGPHNQQMPYQQQHMQGMHSMGPPMFSQFSNGPQFNGQFHSQQQPFFRPSPGPQFSSPMPGAMNPGQSYHHLPHQNAQSPMLTGAVPQLQGFGPRRDSQQQLAAQFQSASRAGSFSSLAGPAEVRRELSPGPPESAPTGRVNSLSPHVGAAAVGAIGERPSSGPASSNGSSSGRAPPPVGLGPLPPNVFTQTPSLGSPGTLSVSPGTAGSNERPFGALGNGGMIRPQVGAPQSGFTTGRVLFIHNLPFQCQWQDLKDLLRPAGTIVRADVALGPDGRSRGFGTVLFASEADAQNAVRMFNGFEYGGRAINVYIDRNADRHNTTPNHGQPQAQRNHFQPYPQFPLQHPQGPNASPFGQPLPMAGTWQLSAVPAEISPKRKEQELSATESQAKSFKVPLTVDTAIATAKATVEPKDGSADTQSRSSSGKHPHPGHITMPSYPNFSNGNMNSPLMTRGLPPMTPSMPGFVFNAYPQTPPLHPHLMSPGFAPFSPGAPVTSPNMYPYNPFMNAAPGAPVVQNGGPGGPAGAPPGRWTGYTAGLQTPQGNGQANGDYFPTLPRLDTSVSTASSSAAASPLNAKQRFASTTPAVAPIGDGSPKLGDDDKTLASAIDSLRVQSTDSSPSAKTRAANRSSIDFTKRGSLSAPWGELQVERRASWDVQSKDVAE